MDSLAIDSLQKFRPKPSSSTGQSRSSAYILILSAFFLEASNYSCYIERLWWTLDLLYKGWIPVRSLTEIRTMIHFLLTHICLLTLSKGQNIWRGCCTQRSIRCISFEWKSLLLVVVSQVWKVDLLLGISWGYHINQIEEPFEAKIRFWTWMIKCIDVNVLQASFWEILGGSFYSNETEVLLRVKMDNLSLIEFGRTSRYISRLLP